MAQSLHPKPVRHTETRIFHYAKTSWRVRPQAKFTAVVFEYTMQRQSRRYSAGKHFALLHKFTTAGTQWLSSPGTALMRQSVFQFHFRLARERFNGNGLTA